MTQRPPQVWAGIDVGKGHHWITVVDADGDPLWNRKVINSEPDILTVFGEVMDTADHVTWALDLVDGPAALLLGTLANHGQSPRYVTGSKFAAFKKSFSGQGKSDLKDSYVIAEFARCLRRQTVPVPAPPRVTRELTLILSHRNGLSVERTRTINRMRAMLTSIFPELERSFDFARSDGPLVLLSGYQTPAAIRRMGESRLTAWLAKRGVRKAATIAEKAVTAAKAQDSAISGEDLAAELVAELAQKITQMNVRLKELESKIKEIVSQHPQAPIVLSMPGFGELLAAELLAAIGDISRFPSAGRLAVASGMAPVSRDSGSNTGNRQRPTQYSRPLQRAFFLSSQSACLTVGTWERETYLRKYQGYTHDRGRHKKAVIAVARQRVSILWAMLRDGRLYEREYNPREKAADEAQAA
ncbi:IS110 family transposase [Streptomyces mirabilis]|uniref:IS110 family transposase n=1 Tax=Streptomyces mirabilis TaxID=68239 RepID=UPI00224CA0F4|nr:IS110 family transposase [Streptomyces mirabilis]MCX4610217.1 IS110 family transposase [Streptomyces mirabilis]MCX4615464.1 IS110 family transposase [Streptomyces mirabilis]